MLGQRHADATEATSDEVHATAHRSRERRATGYGFEVADPALAALQHDEVGRPFGIELTHDLRRGLAGARSGLERVDVDWRVDVRLRDGADGAVQRPLRVQRIGGQSGA